MQAILCSFPLSFKLFTATFLCIFLGPYHCSGIHMRFRSFITIHVITLILFISFNRSYADSSNECCCSWQSPSACAHCPPGFLAGCATFGSSKCTCTCAKTKEEMSRFLETIAQSSKCPDCRCSDCTGLTNSRWDISRGLRLHGFGLGDFHANTVGGWQIKVIQVPEDKFRPLFQDESPGPFSR
jgi:hypothetical protein